MTATDDYAAQIHVSAPRNRVARGPDGRGRVRVVVGAARTGGAAGAAGHSGANDPVTISPAGS